MLHFFSNNNNNDNSNNNISIVVADFEKSLKSFHIFFWLPQFCHRPQESLGRGKKNKLSDFFSRSLEHVESRSKDPKYFPGRSRRGGVGCWTWLWWGGREGAWRRIAIPLEDRGCQQTIHRSFLVKVSPAESNDSFESRFLVGSTPDSFAETNPRKNLHFRNSLRAKSF